MLIESFEICALGMEWKAMTPKLKGLGVMNHYSNTKPYLAKFTIGKHGKKPLSAQLIRPTCTPSILLVLLKIPT